MTFTRLSKVRQNRIRAKAAEPVRICFIITVHPPVNNEKCDRIALMVPKGKKEEYKAVAEANGESLNGYINRLLEENQPYK